MKKIFFVLAVLFVFAIMGCQQATGSDDATVPEVTAGTTTDTATTTTPVSTAPTVTNDGTTLYVKNSVWDNVDLTTLPQYKAKQSARSVGGIFDLTLANEIVAEYNAETDGDQLVILTEDTPIEESPNVTVYFAKAVNGFYEIHSTYIVERSYYRDHRQNIIWDAAAFDCEIFVDKVPETAPPPYVDPRTPYEKYSLYVVEEDGSIAFEEHCSETWQETDYKSVDTYFAARLIAFTYEAYTNNRRVVSGQIYTPPIKISE